MVNVFADQSDVAIKENCRKRLLHIVELEHELLGMVQKTGSFPGLLVTPLGTLVCLDGIQVMQHVCRAQGKDAGELLFKVAAYCSDKVGGGAPSEARTGAVKLKTEGDIYKLLTPLEPAVLHWLDHGLDLDAKGKDDDQLAEDEFLCLLMELRAQLRAAGKCVDGLLPCVDTALRASVEAVGGLKEDSASDLHGHFPGIMLDLARILREHEALNADRIRCLQSIFSRLAMGEDNSLQSLKFKVLLATDQQQQEAIIVALVEELETGTDWSVYTPLMDEISGFAVNKIPLYNALEAKSPHGPAIVKTLLEMTITELQRSPSMDRDEWAMGKLELLAQSIKNSYSSEAVELLLKHSKEAIDLVISRVIPRLERALLEDKERVLAVLKRFQQFTRTLQTFCNHIKATKDKGLLKRVPPVKRSLEASLLRVKQMLQANNCHGAFWVGNLKHKGLDGREVESQIPLKRQDEDEGEADVDYDDEEEDEDEEMESPEEPSEPEDPTLALSL